MRGMVWPALALLTGCGSSWNLRVGEEIVVGCLGERLYFVDLDQDGWGDATLEPQVQCGPSEAASATNGLDCDDADPAITGRVGSVCPNGLVVPEPGAPAASFAGAKIGESELVWLYDAETPTRDAYSAQDACGRWAPSVFSDGVWTSDGGLATFNAVTELATLQQAVVASAGTAPYAAWVGIVWDGTLDEGRWSWADASDDLLIEDIGYCGGEPAPADFFPSLFPEDPVHREVIEAALPELRLALVLDADGRWCFGRPDQALLEDGTYQVDAAHLVCERPIPDPDAYAFGGTGEASDGG